MMDILIERAGIKDAAEILALQRRAYQSEAKIYGDYDIPPLTQTLAEMRADLDKLMVLKALFEERIVGSVRARLIERTCHVGRLIVDPEFQNRGIGTRLLDEIEACFAGAARFELFTGHLSARNLYLYHKLGYREFQRQDVSPALTLVYLEKHKGQISSRDRSESARDIEARRHLMSRPPNLLFICTDEQRADTLAPYGNHRIDTPNLNRLATESVVFERTYVTQPVCTPSRSTLMSGLYPHSNGCIENNIPLRDDIVTLPEMLSEGGYVTGYHGKWHLGDEIFCQRDFAEWRSIEDTYIRYYSEGRDRSARSTYHHWLIDQGFEPDNGSFFTRAEAARLPEAFGKPAYLAHEASRFMREHCGEPFALFVNLLEPHMPFFGPRDDQYDPSQVALPSNYDAPPTDDQPLKARLFRHAYHQRGHSGLPLRDEQDWRRMIAHYWGLCSLVDTHVGTILTTLYECELDEHTIVVYTSDHGDMMGSHQLLAKCVAFEEAIRVPMLIRMPDQRRQVCVPGPVSQIDLMPTLLDLLGFEVPVHLQGQSLRPQIEGQADATRDVFVEWNGHNNGLGDVVGEVSIPQMLRELASRQEIVASITDPVRTVITPDGCKLNYSTLGHHELYDLKSDPGERHNLAARPEMRERIGQLAARIRSWQARTLDGVELPE